MRTSSAEVLIELDRSRARGLRAQVEDGLRAAIRDGRLVPGTSLPSSRILAADLGVTRGVVVAAYDQLIAEGYLVARPGSGTVVNAGARTDVPGDASAGPAAPVVADFTPGLPDLDLFPRAAWLRATRTALHTMRRQDLGYTPAGGLTQLRQALADYLGRVRGVCAQPEQVVISQGFGHGFSLVAGALAEAGHDVVAVEDPGYAGPRQHLAFAGGSHEPIPVDAEGIDVEALALSSARAVVVTPAHQMPTGAVLSAARRSALVAWARRVGGYVIEDDYDAEYRYDRHPVGALQGVAPDRVVYCGTASKSLAPGLRLGWAVLPRDLVDPVLVRRRTVDESTSSFLQATYAAFLAAGELDRHLRRTRRIYRQRRDALMAALARWLPTATPGGISAGLHVLVTLPPGVDERELATRAREVGVRVYPVDRYRSTPPADGRGGLVMGYGSTTPERTEHGIRLLAEVLADLGA
jgi:GntR family transcriptional regulator/MocR family aminotransferase